jgi:alpha-N-arabinofuranosidase
MNKKQNTLNDAFTYDKQSQYIPVTKVINTDKNRISYSFPAHSFTQIKVEIIKQ